MSARATRSSARLKKRKPGADDEQPADLAVLAEAATATKRRRPNSPQEEAQLKQEQAAANCKSTKTLATLNRIMRELGDMLGKPGCGCHLGILRAGVKRLREQTQQLCDLREELSVVTRREVCNTAAAKLRAKIEEDFRRECAAQDEEAKAQAAAAEKEQSSASTAAAAASAAQTPEEARVQYNKRLNTMYIVIHRLLFAPRAEVDGKKYALPSCLTGAETDSDPSGMCRVQLLSSLRDRLLGVAREVRATSQLVRLAKHAKYKELMAIAGRTEDQCFHCVLRHTTKAVALGLGDGRLVEVSPAFSKLVGWSREHLLYDNGANIADILAPQTAETVMGRVAAVASGQTKCWKTNQAFFRACAPDAGAGAEPSSSSAAAAAAASAAAAPPDADAGSRLESLQEFMAKHPHRVQTKRCCMSINPVEDVSGKTFVFYMLGVPTSEGNCV